MATMRRQFASALATLKAAPKEVTWKAGIDVLCFNEVKWYSSRRGGYFIRQSLQ